MDTEPGVVPLGKELLYQRVIKTPFVFQNLQDRSTEEFSKRLNSNLLHHIKIPGLGEESIHHQSLDMRMPFAIVTEGLDGQGDAGNPQLFAKSDPKNARAARWLNLPSKLRS